MYLFGICYISTICMYYMYVLFSGNICTQPFSSGLEIYVLYMYVVLCTSYNISMYRIVYIYIHTHIMYMILLCKLL